ncbi:hypothetical protein B0T25DRAFT_561388 [Lasiosphaeria hispida]|uniref:Uncharacterized protein n=1 Tax=Lasiosphaeria hispida TaxID=260671 RepID=A0AAJ0MJ14_9PEZI|nr:hypothetical protein B0T25DRAFT_561388 [Lasiosphaeria hispida]
MAKNGKYYDTVNHLIFTRDWDELWDGQDVLFFLLPAVSRPGEKGNRTTNDICEAAWEPEPEDKKAAPFPFSLAQLKGTELERRGLHTVNIGDLGDVLMTRLVFHEFMHARCYLLDDFREEEATSSWAYCMARKKGEAAGCAESMAKWQPAYFGLWAGLADLRPLNKTRGGFTMDRRWDSIPGYNHEVITFSDDEEDDDVEDGEVKDDKSTRKWDAKHPRNDAVRGRITYYGNLTGARPGVDAETFR